MKLVNALGAFFLASAMLPLGYGAPVHAETRIEKTFGNWLLNCVEPDEGATKCQLTQSFTGVVQETKQQIFVFSWVIVRKDDGQNWAVLRTRLGVNLKNKLRVTFPADEIISLEFDHCDQNGCIIEFAFSDAWADAFVRHESAAIAYDLAGGRNFSFEFSLDTFQEAFNSFNERIQ